MNAIEREQLRNAVLRILDAARGMQHGLPAIVIAVRLADKGHFNTPEVVVRAELDYLQGAGLVRQIEKPISKENYQWKISQAGADYVAELDARL
jgi:hypothetical protein